MKLRQRIANLGYDLISFAKLFDHTLLKPDSTEEDIHKLISEARYWGFHAVCVNPVWVKLCSSELKGTGIKVCSVIGFPLGATTTYSKIVEAINAVADGAQELDMVINIGYLKSGMFAKAEAEIRAVKEAIGSDRILKVIIECCLLSEEEKEIAVKIVLNAGADYVKTSTGFSKWGAVVDDVKLLSSIAKPAGIGVKAAGGIRDLNKALDMLEAGATRLGASNSVRIMEELKRVLNV